MRIQPSQAKHRLFIGGIPHDITRDGLEDILITRVKGASTGLLRLVVCGGGRARRRQKGACVGRGGVRLRGSERAAGRRLSPPAPRPPCLPKRVPLAPRSPKVSRFARCPARRRPCPRAPAVEGPHPSAAPPTPAPAPPPPAPPPPGAPHLPSARAPPPPGLEKIEMSRSKDPAHPELNRGFAFLEFYNSECAQQARTALCQPDFK